MKTVDDAVESLLAEWEAFLAVEARTGRDPLRRLVFWGRGEALVQQARELAEQHSSSRFGPLAAMDAAEDRVRKELRPLVEDKISEARRRFSPEMIEQPPLAILVAPKSRRVFIALARDSSVDVAVPFGGGVAMSIGQGYVDSEDYASKETGCLRVHTPKGVVLQNEGLGLLLYGALALYAAIEPDRKKYGFGECISSCGPYGRSREATKWWNNQVRRGIAGETSLFRTSEAADRFDVCQWIDVRDVMRLGIVLRRHPSLEWLDSRWRKPYLSVLLATRVDHIPDETFLRYWVGVLEREGATDEVTARYLIDNGHGALIGVDEAPKRFVANRRDAFAKFFGSLVEVD